MSLVEVLPTPDGIVTVFRGDIDAESVAQALMALKAQRAVTNECIDDLTNILRFAVEKTGKLSAVFGNVKVNLLPRESMVCDCHGDSVLTCPKAVTGKEIRTIMAPVARYVRVSLVNASEVPE